MKIRFAIVAVLIAAGLVATDFAAHAQSVRPQSALTIVAGSSIKLFAPSFGRVDVGTVYAGDRDAVMQAFTIRNDSNTAITITTLSPSCKCVEGSMDIADRSVGLPVALLPRASADVVMIIDIKSLSAGPFDKFLAVRTKGTPWPAATFEIIGTLSREHRPAAGHKPGKSATGETKSSPCGC